MASEKPFIDLQPGETAILQAAAQIYSGYLAAGKVIDAKAETEYLKKSASQAISLAQFLDAQLDTEGEMGQKI